MTNLHSELVDMLGLRIVRGDYPPGARIDIDSLEPEFGVSKTAIREALRVIREKGLIDSWPKRGTIVNDRAAWKLLDSDVIMWRRSARRDDDRLLAELSQLRDVIEPAAAKLAAQYRKPEDIAALSRSFEEFAKAGHDVERLAAADQDFHINLLRATHNELMMRLDVVIVHALNARNRIQHHPGADWLDPVPDHQAVLDAVVAGDPEAAEAAMRFAIRESDVDLSSGEPVFEEPIGHSAISTSEPAAR
ncbi:FadR/GntR family transcriptional regulator [Arthrobacter sp. B1I2]|uniref:FadR/GntR family transcriptional regulator n=1 Tax=Arthrobacter sp. B1I2 TaxID=3042263 RepID=UPI0027B8E174|nr:MULTISPECIES: FadR/GntR family transcriptional regulator [Arthrobacter]